MLDLTYRISYFFPVIHHTQPERQISLRAEIYLGEIILMKDLELSLL